MKLCTGAILDIQKQAERVQACQIINHHRSLASMFQDFQCWSPELITFLTSEGMTFRTHALILYFLYDSFFPCFSATFKSERPFYNHSFAEMKIKLSLHGSKSLTLSFVLVLV